MSCDTVVTLSASSDSEWIVENVRRASTGEAYPVGTVTVSVRLYDPTGVTPIGSAITATFDNSVNGWSAIIPPVSNVYALAIVRETVVANGRTRVTDVSATIAA